MPSNLELLVDVEPTHRGRIQSHLPYPSQPEMVLLAVQFDRLQGSSVRYQKETQGHPERHT